MQLSLTKTSVIHPILFAIVPILSIISVNLDEIILDDVVLPFLIVIPSVIAIWYVINLILKNKMKSGLVVSFGIFLFFSYGHFFDLLSTIEFEDFDIFHHRYVLISFFTLFLIGFFLIRKIKKNTSELTLIVNVIAITLILFSVTNITTYVFENKSSEVTNIPNEYETIPITHLENPPNVYYIILDEYSSSKVLDDIYNFDNQQFLSELQSRGFYIAENSNSNYAQTFLSVTSALNMKYLNYVSDEIGVESSDTRQIIKLFEGNKVMNTFKSYNYTILDMGNIVGKTNLADYYLCGNMLINTELQITLWESTMLKPVFVKIFADQAHRDKILCKFSELSNFHNSIEEPFFVYAHFQLPHPPYVFGPNGESKQPKSLSAGASAWDDKIGYTDQVQFTNKKILETIDKILLESNSTSVIILQGDHGTPTLLGGGGLNWNNINDESISERMSIFNAYYFPDQRSELIYDPITPVNSFRVILNEYFNENYELLEDRIYFSDYKNPYNFTNVTEIFVSNSTKD